MAQVPRWLRTVRWSASGGQVSSPREPGEASTRAPRAVGSSLKDEFSSDESPGVEPFLYIAVTECLACASTFRVHDHDHDTDLQVVTTEGEPFYLYVYRGHVVESDP